jgi:hypothetical protein
MNLSIILPSLRPQNLIRFYNSAALACKCYKWELVVIGPFDPPVLLLQQENVKFIKSYASVTVCLQKATLEATGDLICNQVDDGVLNVESLDYTIDQYYGQCKYEDLINCRYQEGVSFSGKLTPPEFWEVKHLKEFHLPAINRTYATSVQPLLNREWFLELGGYDCRFGYSNHAHHDFCFRLQNAGGKVYHSKVGLCNADHFPLTTKDHREIHNTQLDHDEPLFNQIWSEVTPTPRSFIKYDQYIQYDKPWSRFAKQQYHSYQEMCVGEGYQM